MIDIKVKKDCCGCSSCVQICPKQCISFDEDSHGFRYPLVDKSVCIGCDLCEKVCPVLNQSEAKRPLHVYAAINLDEEVRMKSSSGGIFTMLAESIIDDGGVVFGARFDKKWEVEHSYTESKDGLEFFRGSKYVQSRIGNTYVQARNFLNEGRKVIFTGTSCQIAGLKKFLRKEYDNLLAVDVVCHGTPSPLVWRTYLEEILTRPEGIAGKNTVLSSLEDRSVITGISFRDKSTGWKKYGFVIRVKPAFKADKNTVLSSADTKNEDVFLYETLDENLYMQVFLKNLCLRPSCYYCPSKSGKSESDLTIADYWGIADSYPEFDDDKGISLVLANTSKGAEFIARLLIKTTETSYESALRGNPSIEKSVSENRFINVFWEEFNKNGLININSNVLNRMRPSIFRRAFSRMKGVVRRIYNIIGHK